MALEIESETKKEKGMRQTLRISADLFLVGN